MKICQLVNQLSLTFTWTVSVTTEAALIHYFHCSEWKLTWNEVIVLLPPGKALSMFPVLQVQSLFNLHVPHAAVMLSHLPGSFTITHWRVSSVKHVKSPSVNHRAQCSHCTLQSVYSQRVSVEEIFKSVSVCTCLHFILDLLSDHWSWCVCTLLYLSICVDKKIITCCWSAGFSHTPLFGKQRRYVQTISEQLVSSTSLIGWKHKLCCFSSGWPMLSTNYSYFYRNPYRHINTSSITHP